MAGSGKDAGNGIIGGINVTPLVDIRLVLLIIFMVTAKLVIAPSTALPLTLPKAATGEALQVVFAISLTSDGKAFIDGKPVPGDEAIKTRAADELAQQVTAFLQVPWRKCIVLSGPIGRRMERRQIDNRRHGDRNPFLFGS